MARKAGLGRGLSALMEEMGTSAAPAAPRDSLLLPVAAIAANPRQPRRQFDDTALNELSESVRLRGVLQPILVRPLGDDRYEIIAGERRWRAAQQAGLHEIPALVRPLDEGDSFEVALIENIQRQDLNPIEEADGYQRLVSEYQLTQQRVAELVGKSRSHIANLLRLAELPANVRDMVRDGRLSLGHAKVILGAADPQALAEEATRRGWSVRQTEAASRKQGQQATDMTGTIGTTVIAPAPSRHNGLPDADTEALEYQLSEALGLPVAIDANGNRGSITIRFSDLDQLDALIALLQG